MPTGNDPIRQLAQFGSRPEWTLIAPTGEHHVRNPLTVASSVWSEAQLVATAFDEAAEAIKTNADLTRQGKARQLAAAGRTHLDLLAKLRERLGPVEEARGQAIGKARERKIPVEEQAAALMLQSEIRSLIREETGGDPIQVQILYRDALARADFLTCDAIEGMPLIDKGRPDAATLEKLQAERLAVQEPTLSEEVSDLSAALADCEKVLSIVENDIHAIGGVPRPDDVDALANADTDADAST